MRWSCPEYQTACQISRRRLLQAGTAGIAGLSLPTLIQAEQNAALRAHAKHIIFLHQFGGPSHLDTFDMKPSAPAGIRGEFQPIATGQPGLSVCEHLPRFSRVVDQFAQVRSVHHGMKNHNSATYYSLTGHVPPLDDIRLRDTQELYPAYGSTVARFKPAGDRAVPSFVSFPHVLSDGSVTPGQHASFLGKEFDPFFIGQDPNRSDFRLPELSLPSSMSIDRLDDRRGLQRLIDQQTDLASWSETARGIDSFYSRAITMLSSPNVKRAFDLSQEPERLRDAYGRNTYGQSCLLARRLVEAGVRFVSVYYSQFIGGKGQGWDTHGDNFNQLRDRLLPNTDMAVPTLIEDMKARGLLEETLVVWMGEFGRTPKVENTKQFGPNGRGHWPNCYTVLFAGGGVTPGAIYGASDKIGAYPAADAVTPDDVAATMFWALGIDPATEVTDTLGRPLPIAAGRPITRLFG
jgi:Protein of unknown function (DUF1501)